jgi:hypothetical protein
MEIREQVVIILPLPPRVLSPNCPAGTRGGRFARAAAAKRYKEAAENATVEAAAGMRWEKCAVEAVFYHKNRRRRDDVNHLAMLKPAYDGVVLAGLVPDDDREHLRTAGAEFRVDKKNPRVELIFTRVE